MAILDMLKPMYDENALGRHIPHGQLRLRHKGGSVSPFVRPLHHPLRSRHQCSRRLGFTIEDPQIGGSVAKANNVHTRDIIPTGANTARYDTTRHLAKGRGVKVPELGHIVIHG